MHPPRLIVFSTPLVSTWVLDETHRILFDAGGWLRGAAGRQNQQSQLCRPDPRAPGPHRGTAAVAQSARFGCGSVRGRPCKCCIPKEAVPLWHLGAFWRQFDAGTAGQTQWHPLKPGEQQEIGDDHFSAPVFHAAHSRPRPRAHSQSGLPCRAHGGSPEAGFTR